MPASKHATVQDIHEIARSLPGATLGGARGALEPTVYQVSRRSFLFFRNPRRTHSIPPLASATPM